MFCMERVTDIYSYYLILFCWTRKRCVDDLYTDFIFLVMFKHTDTPKKTKATVKMKTVV